MQPLNGPGVPIGNDRHITPTKLTAQSTVEDQALTPAQRTTLEKLIVRIMALSPVNRPRSGPGFAITSPWTQPVISLHVTSSRPSSYCKPACLKHRKIMLANSFVNNSLHYYHKGITGRQSVILSASNSAIRY